ncbi:MAG: PBP1A family penicillin-binding protein [Proteobacteria bacterium]|nr:PBP1A family penicillin-binding protein [Pseudomonadota bacterium]
MDETNSSLKDIKKRRGKKSPIFKKIFLGVLSLFTILVLAGSGLLYVVVKDLPSIASLKDYRPSIITRVYSDDNRLIDEFYMEDRKVIPITRVPRVVIQAFVAAEDARFFQHEGVDPHGILRAFFKNIEAGRIVQGGSTITQQVAKSLFLSPKKSYMRKLREAFLAYRIDRYLKKYEILNLYLNHIYLGHGTYGIEAASQKYFGKSAEELTLSEAALLAGLPKAPSRYSPYSSPKRARRRQAYVLSRMAEDGYLTQEEKEQALKTPLKLKQSKQEEKIAPYFTENIRRYIQVKYGSNVLYREGLKVYTTLNIEMQKAARAAVERGLRELDKRQGYRGPPQRIPVEEFDSFLKKMNGEIEKDRIVTALVVGIDSKGEIVQLRVGEHDATMALKDMSWARVPDPDVASGSVKIKDPADVLNVGDIVQARILEISETEDVRLKLALEQEPDVQGALLCMDVKTGEIKAMVGGRDFKKSEFNRATQSKRQPGSAFKPFIYTAAFDKGLTPSTIVMDSPIIFKDTLKDSLWKPQNYEEKFYGPTILRCALVYSRNLVTIKTLKDIGIDYAADYAVNMGIISPLARDLSMALGTTGTTLQEIVRAYGVFAGDGKKAEPLFIKKIVDRTGHVFEENRPKTEQVIDPRIAYITTSLLQDVVQNGTGWRMKVLKRPVAGKTGTTNDLKDAWFIGFTPSIVCGVWVGFDEEKPLGKHETGSRAASPICLYFMKKALEGTPVEFFPVPEGVVFARIDTKTGLLAKPDSKRSVFACFLEGTAPTEYTPEDEDQGKEGFFKYDMDVPPNR